MRTTRPNPRKNYLHLVAVATLMVLIFLRIWLADETLSFDSSAYLHFFDTIRNIPISEILTDRLSFPYVRAELISPFEVGFVLISKTLSYVFNQPQSVYGVIAAIAVGVRVHVMKKMGAPWIWIILANIYAITLFEANALRLGLASSTILYGLYQIHEKKQYRAIVLLTVTPLIHMQSAIFIAPFFASWMAINFLRRSHLSTVLIFTVIGMLALISTTILPSFDNEKVISYIDQGQSGAAGITVTSTLGLLFLITAGYLAAVSDRYNAFRDIWVATIASAMASIILLITLTDIAVIGDRSWQLSFVLLAALVFSNWIDAEKKIFPISIMSTMIVLAIVNIIIRYPLSSFFSPLLPGIE